METDDEKRERLLARRRELHAKKAEDPEYRAQRSEYEKRRWEERGPAQNAAAKRRRDEDPEYRARRQQANREKYARTREQTLTKERERYHEDPEYREKKLAGTRARTKNPEYRKRKAKKARELRAARFGLDELVPEGSVCAICKITGRTGRGGLVRDHDHSKPDAVAARGVLCVVCNTTIGQFEIRGAVWLAAMIAYLILWNSPAAAGIVTALAKVVVRRKGQGIAPDHPGLFD